MRRVGAFLTRRCGRAPGARYGLLLTGIAVLLTTALLSLGRLAS